MLQLLAGKDVGEGSVRFRRHRPEQTLLYRLIEQYYPDFEMRWASEYRVPPDYVRREFDEYLKCGLLEHGFLRVQCETCHAEHLVAFSCKRRGFCPSCGTRRMVESTALLVDEVFPHQPIRQWVLSVPFPLRFLFASQPKIMGKALGIVYRTIATHLTHKAGHKISTAHTGAVTLIQRFGSALYLKIHFHMLFLDGVYVGEAGPTARFRWVRAPTNAEPTQITHTIAHRQARYRRCRNTTPVTEEFPETVKVWDSERDKSISLSRFSRGSSQKIRLKCPECGFRWHKPRAINNIARRGLKCGQCHHEIASLSK